MFSGTSLISDFPPERIFQGILINENKNQCAYYKSLNPFLVESNWSLWNETSSKFYFETDYGNCTFHPNIKNSYSDCCKKLGFEDFTNISFTNEPLNATKKCSKVRKT